MVDESSKRGPSPPNFYTNLKKATSFWLFLDSNTLPLGHNVIQEIKKKHSDLDNWQC